jgi:hypothetical protein
MRLGGQDRKNPQLTDIPHGPETLAQLTSLSARAGLQVCRR